jgi:hypothetical protein
MYFSLLYEGIYIHMYIQTSRGGGEREVEGGGRKRSVPWEFPNICECLFVYFFFY